MLHIERADGKRRFSAWTLALLLAIPVLVTGGLLAAAQPSTKQVNAAIVNLDKAVTLNGQIVPLGRQFAAAVVEQKENITWTLADLPSGESGLSNGEYSVLVVIPQSFSAAATSYSGKADQAKQATIDIRVGKNSPVTDAEVAQQIARVASDVLNTMLTESYLDQIYIGFNTMGEQFTTMVDGAKQLADGASKLNDGLGKSVVGASALADGMGQFADGTGKLSAGIQRMNTQSAPLFGGIGAITDGTKQTIGGVDQLAGGLRQFESQVRNSKTDYSELEKLKKGAAQIATGTAGLSGGINQISDMLKALTVAKLPNNGPSVPVTCPVQDPETCRIFEAAIQVMQNLSKGKVKIPPEMFDRIKCPVSDAAQCATFNVVIALMKDLASGEHEVPEDVIAAFKCPSEDPQLCALLFRTYLAGFQTGTGVAWAALNAPDPATRLSLKQGAAQLAGGTKQFSEGIAGFVDKLPKQAAAKQKELADGIGKVAAGAETIVEKAQPLLQGAGDLAKGVQQFKAGLATLASEVSQLPAGADQLATGTRELATGLGEAKAGAGKLSEGLNQFAKGLEDGKSKVPYYSAEDRASLKKVVSRPILSDTSLLSSPLAAVLAVLLIAAMWVAALATYLVVRPVPTWVLTSSRPTWQLAGASLAPGMAIAAAQGALMGGIGAVIVGLSIGAAAALIAVLVAAGAAFVAVNHAIAAWFGGWGRAVFLGLAMFAVAAAITSGAPAFVPWLGALSPVAPAISGVRSLMAGANLVGPLGWLLVWLVIGVAASYVLVMRSRQLSPAQFRRLRPDAD